MSTYSADLNTGFQAMNRNLLRSHENLSGGVDKAKAVERFVNVTLALECPCLHYLLTSRKDDYDVKAAVASKEDRTLCFTVEGKKDDALVRDGLPRGLHITVRDGRIVHKAGFLPKFDNLGGSLRDALGGLRAGAKVQLNPKYSGNLIIVAIHKDIHEETGGEMTYFSVFTKNSAGGKTKHRTVPESDLAEYLGKTVDLRSLYDHGVRAVVFEAMLLCDQTHGSPVVSVDAVDGRPVNAYVCTSMHGESVDPENVTQLTPQVRDWKRIALEHGLPVDPGYEVTIEEEGNRGRVHEALERLDAERDFLTVSRLHELLREGGFVRPFADHPNAVEYGSVMKYLEGLVIIVREPSGKTHILKFKVSDYTRVTFGLRAWLQARKLGNFREELVRHAHRYANIWCNSPEGKAFRYAQVVALALLMEAAKKEKTEEEDDLVQTFREHVVHPPLWARQAMKAAGIPESEWTEPFKEAWILAFEFLEANADAVMKWVGHAHGGTIADYAACFPWENPTKWQSEEPPNGVAPVVVIVGPIGTGKTTAGDRLADELRRRGITRVHHVDCDKLDFCYPTAEHLVRSLGFQRNTETWCCILKAIASGEPVIVSAGGGQLFADSISMLHRIAQLLDKRLDLTVALANSTQPEIDVHNYRAVQDYYATGNPQVILDRLGPGGSWHDPSSWDRDTDGLNKKGQEMFSQIMSRSGANIRFFRMLCALPGVKVMSASDLLLVDVNVDKLAEEIEGTRNDPTQIPNVQTVFFWVLCEGGKLYHITRSHMGNTPSGRPYEVDPSALQSGNCKDVPAYAMTCSCSCALNDASDGKKKGGGKIAILWCPELGDCAHVTLSPGPFKPAQMREVAQKAAELRGEAGDLELVDQHGNGRIVSIPAKDAMRETTVHLVGTSFRPVSFAPPSCC